VKEGGREGGREIGRERRGSLIDTFGDVGLTPTLGETYCKAERPYIKPFASVSTL
jgi:hypothetical protein